MFSPSKDVSSTDFLRLLGVLSNSWPPTLLVDGFAKSVSETVSGVSLFLERFKGTGGILSVGNLRFLELHTGD